MKRQRGSARTYLILFIIMFIAVIGVMFMLNMAKNVHKAEPLKTEDETTTTKKEAPIVATNFSTSLADIIDNNRFLNNYKEEIIYSGAVFNFNCTKYDEEKDKCLEGSGLMNLGSALLPLYTYKNDEENYLNRAKDYYIVVNDEYIILAMNNVGVSKGVMKVYGRDGKKKYEIENFISGYKGAQGLVSSLYPIIEENKINYYACESKHVKVLSRDLSKPDEIEYLEDVEKVSCN